MNERFGRPGWEPVRLDVRDDFPASVAAYMEYDVLLVNPVMDGLNLVAKEAPLVNARDGVLVLSRNAGAYEELADSVARRRPVRRGRPGRGALARDRTSPADDRRSLLDGIRAHVRTHDLEAWASRELAELDQRAAVRAG